MTENTSRLSTALADRYQSYYDVSSDGQRFIMAGFGIVEGSSGLVRVTNFFEVVEAAFD